jgi:hypothetical protein
MISFVLFISKIINSDNDILILQFDISSMIGNLSLKMRFIEVYIVAIFEHLFCYDYCR